MGNVVNAQFDPVGIAEVEFGKVAVQAGFADERIYVVDAALHDREITFDGVGFIHRHARGFTTP